MVTIFKDGHHPCILLLLYKHAHLASKKRNLFLYLLVSELACGCLPNSMCWKGLCAWGGPPCKKTGSSPFLSVGTQPPCCEEAQGHREKNQPP